MKIDLGWIQKELDDGREVKLEGINGCYINKDNRVLSVEGDGMVVSFGTGKMWFSPDSFKNFRIKRTAQTFDDVFDKAVQASKEGKLYFRFLSDDQISFVSDNEEKREINILKTSCDYKDLKEAIDFINSLYTETFVIESEEDLKGLFTVDENMTITTVNGSVFRFGDFGKLIMLSTSTLLKLIKGATVTRKIP